MVQKVSAEIKFQAGAGKANPATLGSVLGPAGVNIMEFCKQFNANTQSMEENVPIPVVLTVYADRSFSFITKKPPVSYYIKKAAGINKGASNTGRETVAEITMQQIQEVAKEKIENMNARDIDAACQMLVGSARSMGIKVVEK